MLAELKAQHSQLVVEAKQAEENPDEEEARQMREAAEINQRYEELAGVLTTRETEMQSQVEAAHDLEESIAN